MPGWRPPRAIEIDKKLRDDFRCMLREYGITTPETDPILAVLFRSLAAQVEDVYQQAADSIPRAVLDELMAGLGMPERSAQTWRYRLRQGRLELEPALTVRGMPDRYANVRLLLANGSLANGVGVGAVTTLLRKVAVPTLAVSNLTVATGGTDGESFEEARRRFAELLLSRERIVTHADLEAVIMAFEPKIRAVRGHPALERTPAGLRRVHRVTAVLDRNAFTLPDEEARMLQRTLEAHLQERAVLGLEVRVEVAWT